MTQDPPLCWHTFVRVAGSRLEHRAATYSGILVACPTSFSDVMQPMQFLRWLHGGESCPANQPERASRLDWNLSAPGRPALLLGAAFKERSFAPCLFWLLCAQLFSHAGLC